MIMMVAPLSGEVGVCLLWLPDGARRWSAVRALDESRSGAQVAPQHTSIDIGTARAPCFPGGGDTTGGAGADVFNTFDTFRFGAQRKTREALRHRNPAGQRQPTGP
ncbi:hypothetical protein [Burkholderia ambifaria]|uniref:hypothetical protein n=1 Tax=Burkholderia ambifaria TaxID=152480 RepID=UPI000F7FCB81|nr:hypothetical protein [Burkholderia ambifaria]